MAIDFLQLDPNQLRIKHAELKLDNITLRTFSSSHTMYQKIRIKKDWCTFVLFSQTEKPAILNGYHTPTNGICILQDNRDYHATTGANWSNIEIDIPTCLLFTIQPPAAYNLNELLQINNDLLPLAKDITVKLHNKLLRLLNNNDLNNPNNISNQCATKRNASDHSTITALRNSVLDIIKQAIEASFKHSSPLLHNDKTRPSSIVLQAQIHMQSNLIDNPTIDNIAAKLNVKLRTLQRYFIQVLGVTPKQYQLAQKLDSAKRALLQRGRHATVAEIAYEFGFISPSRFTEQYHQQFGETPIQLR